MGEGMSRVLIETMVRKGIREMQEDPERTARNLVDMAIHFSPEGRFARELFGSAQRMLADEQSGYYALVSDVVNHMDPQRLLTFGMLVGYDGFTLGAREIRKTEAAEGFDIPWTLSMELDAEAFPAREEDYHRVIRQARALGVCTYMLMEDGDAMDALSLAAAHADCAFVIFCPPGAVTDALLDVLHPLDNVMLSSASARAPRTPVRRCARRSASIPSTCPTTRRTRTRSSPAMQRAARWRCIRCSRFFCRTTPARRRCSAGYTTM